MKLLELTQKAPNRRTLYDVIQQVYDLPNYGPACTTEYLNEIRKPNSKYLKVERNLTNTIPKGTKRNFTSLETFDLFVKTLEKKGQRKLAKELFMTYRKQVSKFSQWFSKFSGGLM